MLRKGLKYLLSFSQKDGGIYHSENNHKNYETSLTLLALAGAKTGNQNDAVVKDAEKFLRSLQWDETKDIDESNLNYGGAGYGGSSRSDLSNTAFMLDALNAKLGYAQKLTRAD